MREILYWATESCDFKMDVINYIIVNFQDLLKKSIKLQENERHFVSNDWISWFQQIWNKVVVIYHNKFRYCGDLKSCFFFPVC